MSSFIENEQRYVNYTLTKSVNDNIAFKISENKIVSPEEVAADILRALREQAASVVTETVVNAVITVPAYFNDKQRTSTFPEP